VLVSALNGEGTAELLGIVERQLMGDRAIVTVEIGVEQLSAAPWLYENTEILERTDDPETGHARLRIRVPEQRMEPLQDWAQRENVTLLADRGG
jgi:50S ribosomal subunit-associated GTPase HflX